MIKWLITSRTRRKLITLFILNPAEQFYLRQISREIGESPPAISQELKLMCGVNFLEADREGNRNFYRLNPDFPQLNSLRKIVASSLGDIRDEYRPTDFRHLKFLKREMQRIVRQLILRYDPQKIILYGSLATEHVGPESDIDLVIIKDTDKTFFKRIHEIIDLVDYDAETDFFVYTPEEFDRACKENLFFSREIAGGGKVIYEKAA